MSKFAFSYNANYVNTTLNLGFQAKKDVQTEG
jgi:hypothetical protein